MDSVYDEQERVSRENQLLDAEIHRDEIRQQLREHNLVGEELKRDLREAEAFARIYKARVAQMDFIDSLEKSIGSELARQVSEYVIGSPA